MDNDDQQLGRILSRREILALFGSASAALLVGCGPTTAPATIPPTAAPAPTIAPEPTIAAAPAPTTAPIPTALPEPTTVAAPTITAAPTTAAVASAPTTAPVVAVPACIVRPEVTEGPYYVDENLNRSDIRSDPGTGTVSAGIPLVLTFSVAQVAGSGCAALEGAEVEIWHCDADGVYSDVVDRGSSTVGQKFLRGSQMTDANGQATFTTIYPGWYNGRAIHIHFKIRPTSSSVFTSQLFFDDAFSDQVFTQAPYAGKGQRSTLNSNDGIYKPELLVAVSKTDQGYAATFDIGMA
ncbi:MAG: intradiol ring-cleavage dioxygenase [Roseiflexaceae bacterium]|nr:intradiol ring-cleavage dioxygenase [Roseiflexaceae bacterium]